MTKEYFPHDYCARLSLRGIRKDFGLEGLGFYWCFVEMLHEEGGYIKEDDLENIAYDLQVKPELVLAVTHNYDLFTVKKGKISSDRVLRNIKKRAEISAARKQAASARWKEEDKPNAQQIKMEEVEPEINEEENEKFRDAFEWYKEIINNNFDNLAAEKEPLTVGFEQVMSARTLTNNILEEIQDKQSLKINKRTIKTIEFLEVLNNFLRNDDKFNELWDAVAEVEEKTTKGEVKNKQNYLISTLWNKSKMSIM